MLNNKQRKNFKILALDGGGIRGLFSSVILQKIEETFKIKLRDFFDLLIGTSTGSIISSAIALDIPLKDITELYCTKAETIFKKRKFSFYGLIQSKYETGGLKGVLEKLFSNNTLGKIDKPLMIVSSDILNSSVYIFKSNYLSEIENYDRDKEVSLNDAILSSCSAPIYFNPQRISNHYFLCDGGLWANNPSILGLVEAISKFKKDISEIFILSVGTGNSEKYYNEKRKCWGFFSGWGREKLINFLLNLSSSNSTNMTSLILQENYLRINSNIGYNIDDITQLENLKSHANKCFLDNQKNIEKFIKSKE